MDHITKPSLVRLARKAGIKSMSDDCYPEIYNLITNNLDTIIQSSLIVNSEGGTKTLMNNDVYQAMKLNGYIVAESTELGTNTCAK
jgi:histone H3/H4